MVHLITLINKFEFEVFYVCMNESEGGAVEQCSLAQIKYFYNSFPLTDNFFVT
jgi:hypothetical protein